jgi:hypothetical protein
MSQYFSEERRKIILGRSKYRSRYLCSRTLGRMVREETMRKVHQYEIKSLFKGFAAVRDKIIKDRERKNEDLMIVCNGKKMFIPQEQFQSYSYSVAVKDRYTDEMHNLLYFTFKEEDKQQSNLF